MPRNVESKNGEIADDVLQVEDISGDDTGDDMPDLISAPPSPRAAGPTIEVPIQHLAEEGAAKSGLSFGSLSAYHSLLHGWYPTVGHTHNNVDVMFRSSRRFPGDPPQQFPFLSLRTGNAPVDFKTTIPSLL
jgi:hypothetical protein